MVAVTCPFQTVRGGAAKLNTGFYIPLVGLGTYKITGDQVKPAVDAALSCGYRMFDTAKYYVNEPELGTALEELLPKYNLKRSDIFLTTKFFPDSNDPAAAARKLVMESLERLKTDYIDMVLIHYPKASEVDEKDERNPLHRKLTYLELEKLKDEGMIRSVGVSNFESRHIEEIKNYGKMMPCANQVEYHPHFTRDELKEYCEKEGIFFQAFSSLARQQPELIEDPVVVALAKKHNTSVPLVLLSWALSQGVGIVPKSSTPQRIIDNLDGMKEISGGTHMLRTGYAIPLVGLGTYKLNGELMKRAVDAALSVGYRLFDTAKFYFNEADLGEALEISLRRHNLTREDVFITTKIYPTSCEDFYEEIRGILEKSLSDLRTRFCCFTAGNFVMITSVEIFFSFRYVDLVLIHFPKTKDATTNDPANAFHRRNTYLALEKLKSEGMLRSVGVSNYEIRHMEEIKRYAQDMPAVNQVEFHPHFTRVQLRDYCVGNNIFFQAYSSLARHNQELLEHKSVLQIAMKYGTSAPIILLSWALSQEVGVIPKSSQPQRIEENLKAMEIKLSKAEVHLLESLNKDRNYVRCEGWLVD
ncbi:oxidoreductase, aldo/keto reductase family protein [Necator americanus]|uniref:Oxidoreductase, aldo/keto reductase family protein n=1 Tax=Necator americanus TaxID=51031 RepID=W2SGA4_NECAM|nr:oxidoreductase, aldo/keto reductase family protein [Necator americanus]ETN68578.1 oxidoreductase, aldo/keto reductase family protein [Necator americanus]